MPRPAADPYQVGDPVRLELNAQHEAILDYADEQHVALDARVTALEERQVYDIAPTFSQPSGAYSVTGLSAPFLLLRDGTCQEAWLAVASAPVGGPVTVQFLLNDVVIATLQILSGTTDTVSTTLSQAVSAGDELRVNASEVGTTTAAMGVLAGAYVIG